MNLMDVTRKGFCALRMTESPHEWTWTQAEQEEMARAVLNLDNAREDAELERDGLRGKLARLRDALDDARVGCYTGTGVPQCADCSSRDSCDIAHALASDAGEPEAEVIAVAKRLIDDKCPDCGCDECHANEYCLLIPLGRVVQRMMEAR